MMYRLRALASWIHSRLHAESLFQRRCLRFLLRYWRVTDWALMAKFAPAPEGTHATEAYDVGDCILIYYRGRDGYRTVDTLRRLTHDPPGMLYAVLPCAAGETGEAILTELKRMEVAS